MKLKYYDQAIKCFRITNDVNMITKCNAFTEADKAAKLMSQADTKIWRLKNDKSILKKRKAQIKQEIAGERDQAFKAFFSAGNLFETA